MVWLGTGVHCEPSQRSVVPLSPTAQMRFGDRPQTARRGFEVGVDSALRVPASYLQILPVPPTSQNVRSSGLHKSSRSVVAAGVLASEIEVQPGARRAFLAADGDRVR